MSIQRDFYDQQQVVENPLFITATTQLTSSNQVVRIGVTTGNITVTLPPVAEAAGKFYSILAPTIGTDSNAVTLADKDDESEDWTGDFTLDEDNDGILLYSDGRKWIVIANEIA